MRPSALLLFALLLAGCQVYAGGGTLVSDGRMTVVRTAEVEAEPGRVRTRRATDTILQPDGGGY